MMVKQLWQEQRSVRWLLALLVFVTLLPLLVQFVVVQLAYRQGFDRVELDDVDINLFALSFSLEGLRLEKSGEQKLGLGLLGVNLGWSGVVSGEVALQSVQLNDVALTVLQSEDGALDVVVPIPAASESAQAAEKKADTESGAPLKVSADSIALQNISVAVSMPTLAGQFVLDSLSLKGLSSWRDRPMTLALAATWEGSPLALDLNVSPHSDSPSVKGGLLIQGLPLDSFAQLAPPPVAGLAGKLSADLAFEADWPQRRAMQVGITGTVAAADLAASYQHVALGLQQLSLEPSVTLTQRDEELVYQLALSSTLQALSVSDPVRELTLLALDGLSLKALSFDHAGNMSVASLGLKGLGLLGDGGRDNYLAWHEAIDGEQLSMAGGQSLGLGRWVIRGLNYQLLLDEEGELPAVVLLQKSLAEFAGDEVADPVGADPVVEDSVVADPVAEPTKQIETEQAEKPDTSLAIALDALEIESGSRLQFQDRSMAQPLVVFVDTLSLKDVDQQQPGKRSPFILKARLGEYGKLDFSGDTAVFAEDVDINLKGSVDGVPLPLVSPYLENALAYQLVTGQYDHQLSLKLAEQQLQMENQLALRGLAVKGLEEGEAGDGAGALKLPLPMALNMLRDGDGNIDLKVPVKGDLSDPEVGLNALVTKALSSALQQGSISYLQYALQPYGAVAFAAGVLLDQVQSVSFEPVKFVPGGDTLEEGQEDYVAKLVALLKTREALTLNLCGVANQEDQKLQGDVEEAQLLALAKARGDAIRRQMVDQGISNKRLFVCKPAYRPDAVTGVMVSM